MKFTKAQGTACSRIISSCLSHHNHHPLLETSNNHYIVHNESYGVLFTDRPFEEFNMRDKTYTWDTGINNAGDRAYDLVRRLWTCSPDQKNYIGDVNGLNVKVLKEIQKRFGFKDIAVEFAAEDQHTRFKGVFNADRLVDLAGLVGGNVRFVMRKIPDTLDKTIMFVYRDGYRPGFEGAELDHSRFDTFGFCFPAFLMHGEYYETWYENGMKYLKGGDK